MALCKAGLQVLLAMRTCQPLAFSHLKSLGGTGQGTAFDKAPVVRMRVRERAVLACSYLHVCTRRLGLGLGEIYTVRGRKVEASVVNQKFCLKKEQASVVYQRFCLKKEQARALCAPAASRLTTVAQRSLSVVVNFS